MAKFHEQGAGVVKIPFFLHVHAAATATETIPIFHDADRDFYVTEVVLVPGVAATGDNTNRTNINIIDAGASGAGTTEIGNHDYATGTDAVANDAVAVGITATLLQAGDVLTAQYEKVASGLLIGPYYGYVEGEFR